MNRRNEDYLKFENWLNHLLEMNLPSGIVAFNFNLYEGSENTYDIQLIGADEFDEDDEDWACTDYYTSEEDICYIERSNEIKDWQVGLEYIANIVQKYMQEGKHRGRLINVEALSIGFVDGDLKILYRK